MIENRCKMCNKIISENKTVCTTCEDIEPSFNTAKVTILLNKITDIADFVNLVSKCQGDVIVKSERFAVSAKSLMGLYSLDLSKVLEVEFYGDIPYEVREGMKKFIVD